MSILSSLAESATLVTGIAIAANKGMPIEEVIEDKKKRSVLLTNGSVTRLLGELIISPVIRVSSSLKNHQHIESAIKMQMDMFTSFYSKAYGMLITQKGFDADDALRLMSSRQERLPSELNELIGESLTVDVNFLPICKDYIEMTGEGRKDKGSNSGDTVSRYGRLEKADGALFIRELEITIEFKDADNNKHEIKQTLIVRAIIEYIPISSIELALKADNKSDKSFFTNWHKYASGENSLSDLIFGSKLLEEEKRARLRDDRDLIKELHDREDDANRMLLTDGVVGFGKYYLMVIVDNIGKAKLENIVKDRLSKPRGKDAILDSMKAMSITVMDDDFDTAITYFESLPGSTEISYKKLTKREKSDDLTEVLKMMAMRG